MQFTSDITVTYMDSMGSDEQIARDASASLGRSTINPDRVNGLVRFLTEENHTSPFEHQILKVHVKCPLNMAHQWHRHRTQSYNQRSLRYTGSDLEFYFPPIARPLKNYGTGAHPDIRDHENQGSVRALWFANVEKLYQHVEEVYSIGENLGIANEVIRGVLPTDTMTTFIATANLGNWFRFLYLRNGDVGHPQWEIASGAKQVESLIAKHFPIAHQHWKAAMVRLSDEEDYDERMLMKVYESLAKNGLSVIESAKIVNYLQNSGILFRERA